MKARTLLSESLAITNNVPHLKITLFFYPYLVLFCLGILIALSNLILPAIMSTVINFTICCVLAIAIASWFYAENMYVLATIRGEDPSITKCLLNAACFALRSPKTILISIPPILPLFALAAIATPNNHLGLIAFVMYLLALILLLSYILFVSHDIKTGELKHASPWFALDLFKQTWSTYLIFYVLSFVYALLLSTLSSILLFKAVDSFIALKHTSSIFPLIGTMLLAIVAMIIIALSCRQILRLYSALTLGRALLYHKKKLEHEERLKRLDTIDPRVIAELMQGV